MNLNIEDTDFTMNANAKELADAVIGHRIVKAEKEMVPHLWYGAGAKVSTFVITLDNGKKVELHNTEDCCAYTQLNSFLLHADKIDHIITGVGTTNDYETWHIYADMGDVLELNVGWSYGNPYYYGYGFAIEVKELK